MLNQARIKLRQLLFDDSGVAMAFTIVVFLVFFLLCASVYAMTENIRQKLELQNACDAAAYSGAVVQADMLSRIAVLNRALSWTYLQTNKRQMDYLVGLWAEKVRLQHIRDSAKVNRDNTGCPGHRIQGFHHYASATATSIYTIRMRRHLEVASNVRERVNKGSLLRDIGYGNDNMRIIMSEMTSIRNNMNVWINNAVNRVWLDNGMSAIEKKLFLGGSAYDSSSAPTYFADVNRESQLLAFSGYDATAMGNGQGQWWNLVSNNVIRRTYTRGLVATYTCHSQQWACGKYHIFISSYTLPSRIELTTAYSGIRVFGTELKPSFFGKAGSIVVAAKRTLVNPFTALGMEGIYGAFDRDDATEMWAVSAARAGVRLRENRGTAGYYLVQYPGNTAGRNYKDGIWNLCEEDWDGVLLPVSRAWNETASGSWSGDPTADTLLNAVRGSLRVRTRYSGNIGKNLVH